MQLFHRIFGQGAPLLILHGLFGSSDNWQTLGKRFAARHTVYLIDQRNHGRSPHSDTHTYPDMAEDLEAFMDEHYLYSCSILGHSMGGKTAMQAALFFPERVEKLVVLDIAPKPYPGVHEPLFRAMRGLPLDQMNHRKEAEEILSSQVDDPAIVQFLLKNLNRKKEGGYEWKFNLETLYRHYSDILAGPEEVGSPYDGDALFLGGARSGYILPGDEDSIHGLFPKARVEQVSGAGHWIHADQPEFLFQEVDRFL